MSPRVKLRNLLWQETASDRVHMQSATSHYSYADLDMESLW